MLFFNNTYVTFAIKTSLSLNTLSMKNPWYPIPMLVLYFCHLYYRPISTRHIPCVARTLLCMDTARTWLILTENIPPSQHPQDFDLSHSQPPVPQFLLHPRPKSRANFPTLHKSCETFFVYGYHSPLTAILIHVFFFLPRETETRERLFECQQIITNFAHILGRFVV